MRVRARIVYTHAIIIIIYIDVIIIIIDLPTVGNCARMRLKHISSTLANISNTIATH